MGVVDWRAWTAQKGGSLPTAPNPPGTPYIAPSLFPGVGPIGVGAPLAAPGKGDLIDGLQSFPNYANSPITINAQDPFILRDVGGNVIADPRWATSWAWTAQLEKTGKIMRPVVAGITS